MGQKVVLECVVKIGQHALIGFHLSGKVKQADPHFIPTFTLIIICLHVSFYTA